MQRSWQKEKGRELLRSFETMQDINKDINNWFILYYAVVFRLKVQKQHSNKCCFLLYRIVQFRTILQ